MTIRNQVVGALEEGMMLFGIGSDGKAYPLSTDLSTGQLIAQLSANPTIDIGDIQEIPITGAAAITPSDTVAVTAGRQLAIVCTVAGNVKVKFSDGTVLVFPVDVGFTVVPWAVIQVYVTLTTATATYSNLG